MTTSSKITAKLAFLHAAHDYAVSPSATNWRTLTAAMTLHQSLMFPGVADQEREWRKAQDAMRAVQQLERDRISGCFARLYPPTL